MCITGLLDSTDEIFAHYNYGAAPSRAAFDGGYASRRNLDDAKALGIEHVVFHKKRGLKAEDMTPSSWLYRRLKRFRAGVEAGISYLKRCFGLGRCLWRGLAHFKAYVRSAVFAHNPMRLARLRLQPTSRRRSPSTGCDNRGSPLPVRLEKAAEVSKRAPGEADAACRSNLGPAGPDFLPVGVLVM